MISKPPTVARGLAVCASPLAEPEHLPPATEQQVRARATDLVALAARHGITRLAFASPGRLRGHVAAGKDLSGMFEAQRAATRLLGAEVALHSDRALANEHVSPDLADATPLWAARSARTGTRCSNPGALLGQITVLRDEGDAARFGQDSRYRRVLHRLSISAGKQALARTTATGQAVRGDRTWANLYDPRNHLAHSRLPDIGEALVRRFTWSRAGPLRDTVQDHLRRGWHGRACPSVVPRQMPAVAESGHSSLATAVSTQIWSQTVTADGALSA
jgi:hypothetical protein